MARESFTVDDLLRHMGRLCPEPLDALATTQLYEWRLGALRKCLVALEKNRIVCFIGRDRWKLHPKYPDADAALGAARKAGIDVDQRHG
jgi:hypothetical protein